MHTTTTAKKRTAPVVTTSTIADGQCFVLHGQTYKVVSNYPHRVGYNKDYREITAHVVGECRMTTMVLPQGMTLELI